MENKSFCSKGIFKVVLAIVIVLQVIAALYFCTLKQGFHYDENYSYYSSNVTYGLTPTNGEWMDGSSITDEFMVTDGYAFNYGMVKLMQTYDVHPPFYYYILHTVCSFMPGIFSKWQGLFINLVFFVFGEVFLVSIANKLGKDNQFVTLCTILLYGFSPAIFSGITFIRMYVLLTSLCFLALNICLNGLKYGKRTILKLYLPIGIVTFLGFMTHYYFAVFMFFTAAYMSIYLFIKKETRTQSYKFALSVILGMVAGVLYYPACLSHIFRGYRGTEAIGAFLNAGNISDRVGLFVGLLEEYLLCNTFYLLVLIIVLMYVSYGFIKKKSVGATDINHEFCLTAFVAVGYFLVVMKTALMNYEEAVRYEMPVYGLIILLIVYLMFNYTYKLFAKNKKSYLLCVVILCITLVMQIRGLCNNKVLFLYPEEADEKEFAIEHANDSIFYIYNYVNQWMSWDNAHELEEYDQIYFVEMNNDEMDMDSDKLSANHMYAYVMRYDDAQSKLQEIIEQIPGVNSAVIVGERAYADIYELR